MANVPVNKPVEDDTPVVPYQNFVFPELGLVVKARTLKEAESKALKQARNGNNG